MKHEQPKQTPCQCEPLDSLSSAEGDNGHIATTDAETDAEGVSNHEICDFVSERIVRINLCYGFHQILNSFVNRHYCESIHFQFQPTV